MGKTRKIPSVWVRLYHSIAATTIVRSSSTTQPISTISTAGVTGLAIWQTPVYHAGTVASSSAIRSTTTTSTANKCAERRYRADTACAPTCAARLARARSAWRRRRSSRTKSWPSRPVHRHHRLRHSMGRRCWRPGSLRTLRRCHGGLRIRGRRLRRRRG